MLLSYGAKNFCCFKDWIEIDLSLNSKVPSEISQSKNATSAICIKGANAAGKTNALKALSFISFFCVNSFSEKPDDDIPFEPFFDSKDSSEFVVKFEIDDIEYLYELEATRKEVISEKIFRKEKRRRLVFQRQGIAIIKNTLYNKDLNIAERKNASAISVARQYLIPELEPFYNFFRKIRSNVTYYGLTKGSWISLSNISKLYKNNSEMFAFTKKYLKEFDTGVTDVLIEVNKMKDDEEFHYPIFSTDVEGVEKTLRYSSQSRGTQELFGILALYCITLNDGGVLVLDEFDVYLHPEILPYLVKLFTSPESNPLNAQLLFSTHNLDIIDIMGKYRTVIVNKENGKCFCYRLDEISDNVLRNDRPIVPIYKTGRLGGVPKI